MSYKLHPTSLILPRETLIYKFKAVRQELLNDHTVIVIILRTACLWNVSEAFIYNS